MLRRVAARAVCPSLGSLACRFAMTINVPFIAESINSGKVMNWKKAVGDPVAEDEVICQIESDKLAADVRAPKNGVLTKIVGVDGQTVNVGEALAEMQEGDAPIAAPKPKTQAPVAAPKPAATPVATPAAAPAPTPAAAPKPATPSPIVASADPRARTVRISQMRQRIADRMKASQNTAAMLTGFNEINLTPLLQARDRLKEEFVKKHGVKLGLMSPFAKACAMALQEVPVVNASWGEGAVEYHDYVDISVAVATPAGLVVPVLRDVHKMSLAEIEKKIADYAERAKTNKLTLPEMTGGTFTISNGGTFGSWMGTPIINPPQSAILGMHAIKKRPWVDEKNEVVVRDVMAVALTYDHRLIDGRDAVTFLVKVKSLLEDPMRLLLDLA